MINYLQTLLFSIIDILTFFFFFDNVLSQNYFVSKNSVKVFKAFSILILFFGLSIPYSIPIIRSLTILIFLILLLLLYKAENSLKLFAFTTYVTVIIVVETSIILGFKTVFNTIEISSLLIDFNILLVSRILIYISLHFLAKLVNSKIVFPPLKFQLTFYITFITSLIMVFCTFSLILNNNLISNLTITSILLVLTFLLLISNFIFYLLSLKYFYTINSLSIFSTEQQNSNTNSDKNNLNTRKFKHDLNNNLIIINSLLQDKQYQELETYISDIVTYSKSIPNVINSDNAPLNALLNNKLYECINKQIKTDFKVSLNTSIKNISNSHLCAIIFNLLDNAINEQTKLNDKELKCSIYTSKDKLYIEVENNILEQQNTKNKIRASVKNKNGLGILIIKDIVDIYNGYHDISYIDDKIINTIVMDI